MNISTHWQAWGILLETPSDLLDFSKVAPVATSHGLQKKTDFHVTILGSKTRDTILSLRPDATEEEQENLLSYIEQLATNFDWEIEMRHEFYLLKQDYNDDGIPETRTTIVQMAELPDIDDFYRELNQLLGTKFETPVAHVTLYSHSTRPDKMLRGIGVYTKKQLAATIKGRF